MVAMVYCKKRSAKIISILGIFVNATLFITSCLILQSFYNPTYTRFKNTRFPLLLKYFDWILGMSVTFSLLGIFMNSLLYYGLKKNRRIFMLPWIMWTLPKLVVIFRSTFQHFDSPSCNTYVSARNFGLFQSIRCCVYVRNLQNQSKRFTLLYIGCDIFRIDVLRMGCNL